MNSSIIFEGIGGISDFHVAEFAYADKKNLSVRRKPAVWLLPAAACVFAALGIALLFRRPGTLRKDDPGSRSYCFLSLVYFHERIKIL